jgi:dihydrofolate synthase/folylpolyglutamate synthase
MTYPDALLYLGATRRFGMKLGLEPMRAAAVALGHPEKTLRFIHLAGTNGKGSTAAFCESCLRAAGFRVGLYTSPHLVSVRERVQINRVPISEAAFAEGMAAVREAVTGLENPPVTFFELMTALALHHFAREKIDWVVWETGLGGRLDATNIVTPEVCIITNIGLEHQQYLGRTLPEIAAEKAGIIKPGVPVVSAVEDGEASAVIRRRAEAEGCALTLVHRDMKIEDLGLRDGKQNARIDGHEFALGLIGSHQIENAACAVEAMWQLRSRSPRPRDELYQGTDDAIIRGLATTSWAGRFEIVSEAPLIVLDGAHNPAAMRKLVETWTSLLVSRGLSEKTGAHLVFASVSDKDVTEMAGLLRPLARQVSLVRLANERTADPAELAAHFSGLPVRLFESVGEFWSELKTAPAGRPVLITGSLFLVGEIEAQRGRDGAGEFRLNERLEGLAPVR